MQHYARKARLILDYWIRDLLSSGYRTTLHCSVVILMQSLCLDSRTVVQALDLHLLHMVAKVRACETLLHGVCILIHAGPALFNRGIMESGSPVGDPGVSGNLSLDSTTAVVGIAGCSAVTEQATLNCLRGLDMTTLLTAVMTYENQTATTTAQDIFLPVVDGSLIPEAPSQLMLSGQFHTNISVIAGWAYNDGSIFTSTSLASDQATEGYIMAQYPFFTTSTVSKLLSLYPTSSFSYLAKQFSTPNFTISAQFFRAAQIYRDVNFACPAIFTAQQVAKHTTGPKPYLYEINQTAFATLENAAGGGFEGVIHISEIPYVFNDPGAYLGTASDFTLAAQISGSWAHFAATGNPVGNSTVPSWSVGFTKADLAAAAKKSSKGQVQSAEVNVLGGPTPGMTTYNMSGPETLIERCAFINTLYGQIQT